VADTFFGIDLGTTYSAISYVGDTGLPTVVRNRAETAETTPSVVYFEKADSVIVGTTAKNFSKLYPDRVVERVKRHMGTEREWSFDGQTYTPESISALILKDLVLSAEEATRGPVRQAVITVPAYFGQLERQATIQAGQIAGLDVLGVIPEPVAAALQYNVRSSDGERIVLVYDLGGGTFDTTVMRISPDAIDVICTDGDQELGGVDWDSRLIEYLLDELRKANPGADPAEDAEFMQELAIAAEQLKRQLSNVETRPVPLRYAGASTMVEVTRAILEQITKDRMDYTLEITDRTLGVLGEKLGVSDPARKIDEVLLVGGSTLMPTVTARLTERYGWSPVLHDPHLAVAKGAAKFALSKAVWAWQGDSEPTAKQRAERIDDLSRKTGIQAADIDAASRQKITTVLPKAFGVKLVDTTRPGWQADPEGNSYIEHLVHANETIPSGPRILGAATASPNQTEVEVEVYEQAGSVESREIAANKPVDHGKGIISGLPPLPANSPIEIVMEIDENGRLQVKATEPSTGQRLTIEVQVSVLSEEQVNEAKRAVSRITVKA
jgi:molecular chaperone DnaK (HSP70)